MKRLLFAPLLLSSLFVISQAQQRRVEFRQGDAFRGPVRAARIEVAEFVREDGRLVEGPRRLSTVSTYAPDGKRKEYEGYGPDGRLRERYVFVYDDGGNQVEMSKSDARGNLLMRMLYRPEAGEVLTYGGDGSLRERKVTLKRADGTLAETATYDGSGALTERSVNTRDGGRSFWTTYGPDGSLKRQAAHSLGPDGRHRTEEFFYAPDGSAASRRVSEVDAGVNDLRAVMEKGDGGPPRRTRETREYDSHRNLLKLTSYRWNAETGEYEPSYVSYYTIAYYE